MLSLLAAACSGTEVVTEELGPRSDGQDIPADTTTTTEGPASKGPKRMIEVAINQFFDTLNDGDVAGAYAVMAPQYRDQCTLEDAEAIGAEPTGERTLFEVTELEEVPGGAIVTLLNRVDDSEIPGVGVVLFEGAWYVDAPLCVVLEAYLVTEADSAAKSNLRNALATSKAYFSMNQSFTDDIVELSFIEPNLFNTGDDPVSVSLSPRGNVCLQTLSESGSYWGIWDGITTGIYYGFGLAPLFPDGCPDLIEAHGSGQWSTSGW